MGLWCKIDICGTAGMRMGRWCANAGKLVCYLHRGYGVSCCDECYYGHPIEVTNCMIRMREIVKIVTFSLAPHHRFLYFHREGGADAVGFPRIDTSQSCRLASFEYTIYTAKMTVRRPCFSQRRGRSISGGMDVTTPYIASKGGCM